MNMDTGLETKFARFGEGLQVQDGAVIEGYASLFGACDQGGDVVAKGAYAEGRRVKMLWQHDPTCVIGVWDEVREDARGLFVKGRLLPGVEKAREAASLIAAGAIDGLSIGYRTVRAAKNDKGQRLLTELELWEVSLVTFPMLPSARVAGKTDALLSDEVAALRGMAAAFEGARTRLMRT